MTSTTTFRTPIPPPFGMQIRNRSYTSSSKGYRFGFNGKEKDSEGMGGGGATYDYGFRIYNAQLGKFLSVDPLFKAYPWYTPYQFAGNNPILYIDLDGTEESLQWMADFWTGFNDQLEQNAIGIVMSMMLMRELVGTNDLICITGDCERYLNETQKTALYFARNHDVLEETIGFMTGLTNDLKEFAQKVQHGDAEALGRLTAELALLAIPFDEAGKGGMVASRIAKGLIDDVVILEGEVSWELPSAIITATKNVGKQVPKGGAYSELGAFAITNFEKHHIPAFSISPMSRGKGGAIQMTKSDHELTASWGNSKAAKAYRKSQKELIDNGDFKAAFETDVNDIRSKFGNKYDDAIEDVNNYYIKEGKLK